MDKNNLTSPPRERTSVAIQGLDISTPDDIVADGKCDALHNMRYNAGAWRPVHEFSSTSFSFSLPSAYKVVYKHPASDADKYIVHYGSAKEHRYYEVSTAHKALSEATLIAVFAIPQKISHFGNVLMFSSDTSTTYYSLKDGVYILTDLNFPIPDISLTYEDESFNKQPYTYWKVNKAIHLGPNYPITPNTWYPAYVSSTENNVFDKAVVAMAAMSSATNITVTQSIYNITESRPEAATDGVRIWGNICFFVAYRTADGSILQISPLALATRKSAYNIRNVSRSDFSFRDPYQNSEGIIEDEHIWAEANAIPVSSSQNSDLSLTDYRIGAIIYSVPVATISIPQEVLDNPLIESVAVYATRLNNPFNAYNFEQIRASVTMSKIYSEESMVDQPFYLFSDTPIDDIKENSGTLVAEFTGPSMSRLVHNAVYTPSLLSSIMGEVAYDYNNALHLANTTTVYGDKPHFDDVFISMAPTYYPAASGVEITTPTQSVRVMSDFKQRGLSLKYPYNYIFSYPDTKVTAFITQIQGRYARRYSCDKSLANNFSYCIMRGDDEYQFPQFSANAAENIDTSSLKVGIFTYNEPNRIQVSANNNCFTLPFDRSYSVGSSNNRIIAMQSAAIKIGDEQVGALPLYVFTSEGIYALRAGQETLYAAVNPINYDKIINPNTLSINGGVVYITERGVHILSGEGPQVISTPIHQSNGIPDLNFMRTCTLIYNQEYNEIMLTDGDMNTYIYNLENGYWSTRALIGTKLNTEELVNGSTIYDLTNEDESKSLSAFIGTRPIKLGTLEFKRLETIIPRMSSSNKYEIFCSIVGAVDGVNYLPLRLVPTMEIDASRPYPFVLRRTPFSAKYFKMRINLNPLDGAPLDTAITNIDFEWYRKFHHRMR